MENVEIPPGAAIDFLLIKQAVLVLRTLNNAVCRKIFEQLQISSELTVTEIYDVLHLEQSVASMHLAKMRRHRIVSTQRNGKNILYRLNTEKLTKINTALKQLNSVQV